MLTLIGARRVCTTTRSAKWLWFARRTNHVAHVWPAQCMRSLALAFGSRSASSTVPGPSLHAMAGIAGAKNKPRGERSCPGQDLLKLSWSWEQRQCRWLQVRSAAVHITTLMGLILLCTGKQFGEGAAGPVGAGMLAHKSHSPENSLLQPCSTCAEAAFSGSRIAQHPKHPKDHMPRALCITVALPALQWPPLSPRAPKCVLIQQ